MIFELEVTGYLCHRHAGGWIGSGQPDEQENEKHTETMQVATVTLDELLQPAARGPRPIMMDKLGWGGGASKWKRAKESKGLV